MQLIFNGIDFYFRQPIPPVLAFSVGIFRICIQVGCSLYVSHATKHCYAVLTVCTTFHGVAFFFLSVRTTACTQALFFLRFFLFRAKSNWWRTKRTQLTWFLASLFHLCTKYTLLIQTLKRETEQTNEEKKLQIDFTLLRLYENWISDCDISIYFVWHLNSIHCCELITNLFFLVLFENLSPENPIKFECTENWSNCMFYQRKNMHSKLENSILNWKQTSQNQCLEKFALFHS